MPTRLILLVLFTMPAIGALVATVSLRPTDAAAPAMESALAQRDIESGIPALLDFVAFFAPEPPAECANATDPQVVTQPSDSGAATIASQVTSWFCRFAPNQDLEVEVRPPDGAVTQQRIRTNDQGLGPLEWFSVPGEPLGEYTVTATQGTRRATGTFTISAASTPTLLVFPRSGRPGSGFQIALAGFPPRQRVPLRLYRDIGGDRRTHWYMGTAAVITTDASGQATHTLRMQPDDPIDRYVLLTEPNSGRSGAFDLRP